jgi:hypothetical protein
MRNLDYSGNQLSEESLPKLLEIIPYLHELKLCNLRLTDNIKTMQRIMD